MTTEPKGPYKVLPDFYSGGWWVCGSIPLPKWVPPSREVADAVCESMNKAFLAGRASRDGLREALELVKGWGHIEIDRKKLNIGFVLEALAEDEKNGL